MQCSLKLVGRLRAFVCPWCHRFTVTPAILGVFYQGRLYSSAKQNKMRPTLSSSQQLGRRQPKTRDPIRSIADILLQSLKKRHADRFAILDQPHPTTDKELTDMSPSELVSVIHTKPKEGMTKTEHLKGVEQLLVKRLYKLSLSQMLQACNGFYSNGHKFSFFLSQMLSVVDEMFTEMSPRGDEVTRLFLYIFYHGNAPAMLCHRVEEYLMRNLDKFHVNDLGVVCVGFFRSNSRISSQDLLDEMASKMLQELQSLEPFLLADFIKMFRHASYIRVSFYEKLADQLVQSDILLQYKSINPLMHIAFTYASIPVMHTQLFDVLFSRIEEILTRQRNVRTKDVSKFVWACGTLQYRPENFETRYKQLVQCFEAQHSSREFPESLAEALMGLVYLGIFHKGLLHECLSSPIANKLLESRNDKEKSIQLLLLNEAVKVECPDYQGNLLSEHQMTTILQHPSVSRDLEKELHTRIGLLAVLNALECSLGAEKVHCHYPLLHFKTAVVELQHSAAHGFSSFTVSNETLNTNSPRLRDTFTQRAVTDQLYSSLTKTEPSKVSQDYLGSLSAGDSSSVTRVAILVSSNSQYALNDKTHLLGHLHTMTRQLDKLGYMILQIGPGDALQLELSSHPERCSYLSEKLSSALSTDIFFSC